MNGSTNNNSKGDKFEGELENFEFFEEKKIINESNLEFKKSIDINNDELENKAEEEKKDNFENFESKNEIKEINVFNFDEVKFENTNFNFVSEIDNHIDK